MDRVTYSGMGEEFTPTASLASGVPIGVSYSETGKGRAEQLLEEQLLAAGVLYWGSLLTIHALVLSLPTTLVRAAVPWGDRSYRWEACVLLLLPR